MGKIIGIDLGTTNTVAAIADGMVTRVLRNSDNREMLRSVVAWRRSKKQGEARDEILVGASAMRIFELDPKNTILSPKRLMGRGVADKEVQKVRKWAQYKIVEPSDGTRDSVRIVLGGKEYSPSEVSAMILGKVKQDCERVLGDVVTHAVITVPAYFSQAQRRATRHAAILAGLKVIQILDEPTAAAIAFGVESAAGAQPKNILVFDLGGGTFDISILMWAGSAFAPINLQGDMWLGGDNFDEMLMQHVLDYVRNEWSIDARSNVRFMAALKRTAQEVKEQLSSTEAAELIVAGLLHDDDGDLIDVSIEVTRSQFEEMIAGMVDQTIRLTELAIEKAGLTKDQIDIVLLAGNATSTPMVQAAIEKMFGAAKILRRVDPKLSVAMGASILARRLGHVVCQNPHLQEPHRECNHRNELDAVECAGCHRPLQSLDYGNATNGGPDGGAIIPPVGIAPFPYGTQTAGDMYHVFVEKNEPYPTADPKTQTFYTQSPNQRMVSIPVYGGEILSRASGNEKQGEAFALLPSNLRAGTPIRVKLWLDADQCFKVEAFLDDGTDLKPWFTEGNADARAIEALQRVERALMQKQGDLTPAQAGQIEQTRNLAFERLRNEDYPGAEQLAQQASQIFDSHHATAQGDALEAKGINLIGFTDSLLQDYAWAFPSNEVMRLTRLVEDTRAALLSPERAVLDQKIHQLDIATDMLPQIVTLLLGMKHAVHDCIYPIDPVLASELTAEIIRAEGVIKNNGSSAIAPLSIINDKILGAIKQAEQKIPAATRCGRCGSQLAGDRMCPKCGGDTWLMTHKAPHDSMAKLD